MDAAGVVGLNVFAAVLAVLFVIGLIEWCSRPKCRACRIALNCNDVKCPVCGTVRTDD